MAYFEYRRPYPWLRRGFGLFSDFSTDHILHVNRKAFHQAGFKVQDIRYCKDEGNYVEEGDRENGDEFCDHISLHCIREFPHTSINHIYSYIDIELPTKHYDMSPEYRFKDWAKKFNFSENIVFTPFNSLYCKVYGFDDMNADAELDHNALLDQFILYSLQFCAVLFRTYPNTHWQMDHIADSSPEFSLTKYPDFFPAPYAGTIFWGVEEKGYFSDAFLKHYETVFAGQKLKQTIREEKLRKAKWNAEWV